MDPRTHWNGQCCSSHARAQSKARSNGIKNKKSSTWAMDPRKHWNGQWCSYHARAVKSSLRGHKKTKAHLPGGLDPRKHCKDKCCSSHARAQSKARSEGNTKTNKCLPGEWILSSRWATQEISETAQAAKVARAQCSAWSRIRNNSEELFLTKTYRWKNC